MKKGLLLICSLLLLNGCSNNTPAKSSSICQINESSGSTQIELHADNNIVSKAIVTKNVNANSLNIDLSTYSDEDKQEVIDIVKKAIALSDETSGIVADISFDNNNINISMVVDIKDADETFLADLGITSKEATLADTVDILKNHGATCN